MLGWLFVVAAPYAVTREPYFTSLALSLVFSLGAAALVVFRIAAPGYDHLLGLLERRPPSNLLCVRAVQGHNVRFPI